MRIKADIWVSAYIRRLGVAFVPAMVVRRGDANAGAIFIKINTLDGRAQVLRPAIAGMDEAANERSWSHAFAEEGIEEAAADAYLARQAEFDSDLWVIEVEEKQGRHCLEDFVVTE